MKRILFTLALLIVPSSVLGQVTATYINYAVTSGTSIANRPAGTYLRFICTTVSDLPTVNVIDGDRAFTEDNDRRWLRSGGVWILQTDDIGAQSLVTTSQTAALPILTVTDGQFLQRVGGNIVGGLPVAAAVWGAITGTLSLQLDLQAALDAKLSTTGNGSGLTNLTKTQVGLSNVDNTSDVNKPISSATQTALNGKQASGSYATGTGTANGTNTGDQTSVTGNAGTATTLQTPRTINGVSFNGSANITLPSYTLNVQALTSSPVDAQTIYLGQLPKAPVTTQGTSRIYIRRAGTIRQVNLFSFSGTAGTAESWTCNVRLNNTGDTAIASVASATSERVWTNANLNLSVTTSDYIEVKCVNPTWATNPLTTIFGGYLIVEG